LRQGARRWHAWLIPPDRLPPGASLWR
jgi:hypothetical protein